MEKRTFNTEQKLAILKEASENGVTETLKKHGIFPTTYYSWKKKFNTMGVEGFAHGMTPEQLKRIRVLGLMDIFHAEISEKGYYCCI